MVHRDRIYSHTSSVSLADDRHPSVMVYNHRSWSLIICRVVHLLWQDEDDRLFCDGLYYMDIGGSRISV